MMRKTPSFFLTSILLLLVFILFVRIFDKNTHETPFNKENITLLAEVKNLLDQHLPTPSKKEISDSLIQGFVGAYDDQFSTYFSPEEFLSFQTMIEGDFE